MTQDRFHLLWLTFNRWLNQSFQILIVGLFLLRIPTFTFVETCVKIYMVTHVVFP